MEEAVGAGACAWPKQKDLEGRRTLSCYLSGNSEAHQGLLHLKEQGEPQDRL